MTVIPTCRLIEGVLNDVAKKYEVTPDWITSKKRTADRVAIRRLAQFKMRELGASLTEVGEVFGVDHTSVMHNTRKQAQVYADLKADRKPSVPAYAI